MKSHLQKWTHHVRKLLSQRYDLVQLKRMAFLIALTSCLLLGSIMLFLLYALLLHRTVGLTYTQTNLIALLLAVGMYLCLPVLGYLADSYGPALLLLILIWAFCPAYFVNALLVRHVTATEAPALDPWAVLVMAILFCFVGLATLSLYFASLLTCAKIYPAHKSLAISLPVTCYGLSTLIGSQLMKLQYFHRGSDLDLHRVFLFFSVLYLVVGVLNFVSNLIVSIELEIVFGEEEPLLSDSDANLETELVPQRSNIEPVDHRGRFILFLKDGSAWVLLLSLVLNVGPLESFQNNLGSIIESTAPESVQLADQVSVMAALSTGIRLFIGVVADYMSSPDRKYPISKMWLMLAIAAVGTAGQFSVLYAESFTTVSILNGVCYGGLFTTYPTIIASIWGVDLMGSTWGSFMVAPAVGSILFSLLHGEQKDACEGEGCLNTYFRITGTSMVLSFVCIVIVWQMWRKRGITNL